MHLLDRGTQRVLRRKEVWENEWLFRRKILCSEMEVVLINAELVSPGGTTKVEPWRIDHQP